MGLNRHNPRRDNTEREVIEACKAHGVWPNPISEPGFPDLVCIAPHDWRHQIFALEVKSSENARLTPPQRIWHETAKGFAPPVAIVWDIDSTLEALQRFRYGNRG